jgi:hypothetical protein
MVVDKKKTVAEAARFLGLNHSTARIIVQNFKD